MSHIVAAAGRFVKQATQRGSYRLFAVLGLAALVPLTILALNPNNPPGSNFNMTYWELQLPIGSTGNPTTISSSQPAEWSTRTPAIITSSPRAVTARWS